HSGKLIRELRGHKNWVTSAAFSTDGERIITASADRTARIWDAHSGKLIRELRGHKDRVRSAAFSTDGERIITASDDNTARIWDAENGHELYQLVGLPESWCCLNPDGTVRLNGPNFWRYVA
ncbi:MAG: hypothetical protein B0D92_00100, partial [Spirochaeta sp. LUC14_002_19_P3]